MRSDSGVMEDVGFVVEDRLYCAKLQPWISIPSAEKEGFTFHTYPIEAMLVVVQMARLHGCEYKAGRPGIKHECRLCQALAKLDKATE